MGGVGPLMTSYNINIHEVLTEVPETKFAIFPFFADYHHLYNILSHFIRIFVRKSKKLQKFFLAFLGFFEVSCISYNIWGHFIIQFVNKSTRDI